ncbi:MAG: NTP transferase domain-containing protein [Gemmatimonadetes bacterium]|nr:NTP transferase domain-containing protein [Gemmatimonadota bacterium]
MTNKAVILARGLGKRMRQADERATVDAQQAAVADQGIKAMIPIGRPFLDYVLSALADAEYHDVCLVIGPEHVTFEIQERPIGTANAVLAAEPFAGNDLFLVMNADNYYPVAAYAALRDLGEPGLIAFDRDALIADGHIPPERILKFALLDIGEDGYLRRIFEKPDEATARAMAEVRAVSMNVWCFDAGIFDPCRTVAPSPRGEVELPYAVQHAIEAYGRRFRAVPMAAPVLDLSSRGDIAGVAERLSSVEVRL